MERVLFELTSDTEKVLVLDDALYLVQLEEPQEEYTVSFSDIKRIDYELEQDSVTVTFTIAKPKKGKEDFWFTLTSFEHEDCEQLMDALKSALDETSFQEALVEEDTHSSIWVPLLTFAAFGIWCYFNWSVQAVAALAAAILLWGVYRFVRFKRQPKQHRMLYSEEDTLDGYRIT